MGAGLPKPVTSVPVTRQGGEHFQAGLAEMNGWRTKMEDAHIIYMTEGGAFFGVFDGHGGDECSSFITRRMTEELESKGLPADDETVREMAFCLDQEFIDSGAQSGSTGTFAIVELPKVDGDKHIIRIGNVGDSRVLLGKADGQMVEGFGTDGALTNDHKPCDPGESERIMRTGGHVQDVKGVKRVNGDLAVSRAFGDRNHKQTGGPGPGDRPVSAEPEFFTTECEPTDFLVLVCDGISEGNFPNREVVKLAADNLRSHSDPGLAAVAICRRALDRKSNDNLTCMVVRLSGGSLEPQEELLPGQFWDHLSHKRFEEAYTAMAKRAGCTLAMVAEKRYDLATKELHALEGLPTCGPPTLECWLAYCRDIGTQECWLYSQADESEEPGWEEKIMTLKEELTMFGEGPPSSLALGSAERLDWFETFVSRACLADEPAADMAEYLSSDSVWGKTPDAGAESPCDSNGVEGESGRRVRVAELDTLRLAVEEHHILTWSERLFEVGGRDGTVERDSYEDGTSLVKFIDLGFTAWLPTQTLTQLPKLPPRQVRVARLEDLKIAVEAHECLQWNEKLESVGETQCTVVEEDSGDGTVCVLFGPPHDIRAWLPTISVTDVGAQAGMAPYDRGEVPAAVD